MPLAYLLNDCHLIQRVELWIGYIIDHQHKDGWLGPVVDEQIGYEYDPWPIFVLMKATAQYYDITGDDRIVPAMSRVLTKIGQVLDDTPLAGWGRFRWGELHISI